MPGVDLPTLASRRGAGSALALQGNLDPVLLNGTPAVVRRECGRNNSIAMRGAAGHIFNLGHGILPEAKIECVEALVESVVSWR